MVLANEALTVQAALGGGNADPPTSKTHRDSGGPEVTAHKTGPSQRLALDEEKGEKSWKH